MIVEGIFHIRWGFVHGVAREGNALGFVEHE